jgi:dethiobiotin synthetase
MTRVFLVGTDTYAGKTTVACALLRAARHRGLRAAPFKPAASGDAGPNSDLARLLRAARLPDSAADLVNPLRYGPPLAPGIADYPDAFTGGDPHPNPEAALARARASLDQLEARLDPDLTIIEGAGGLHVPMPGGTWLDAWIDAFEARTLVVARAGLGTINHTLLTVEALRARGHEPLGFVTSQLRPAPDPSRPDNVAVIESRCGVRCLGRLPHLQRPPEDTDAWLVSGWIAAINARR